MNVARCRLSQVVDAFLVAEPALAGLCDERVQKATREAAHFLRALGEAVARAQGIALYELDPRLLGADFLGISGK